MNFLTGTLLKVNRLKDVQFFNYNFRIVALGHRDQLVYSDIIIRNVAWKFVIIAIFETVCGDGLFFETVN